MDKYVYKYCPVCGWLCHGSDSPDKQKPCKYCGYKNFVYLDEWKPLAESLSKSGLKQWEQNVFETQIKINPLFSQEAMDKRLKIVENEVPIRTPNIAPTQPPEVRCPKCNSIQIQAVTRKWSLLTGFLTNKVDRVCLNCKTKF